EISESVIDEKVRHILLLMMRLHMMDGVRKAGAYNTEEHQKRTLEVARESVVLLKNDKKQLPLSVSNTKKVLVIGDNAEAIHSNGGGSAEIKALYEISPLMGIKMLLGGNAQVDFARGYCRNEEKQESDVNWQEASLENGGGSTGAADAAVENQELTEKREKLRKEAVSLAREYDTVIFVGGLNHMQDCEGNDRPDMKLPYGQDLLIRELLEVRPNTIIVMIGGSPVEMGEWIDKADTVVWGWYAGMEGGRALAEVLFGVTNPSGKLPETFYKKHTDCSAHCVGEFPGGKSVHYKEGVFVGYRYNDTFQVEPQFCFGHGLSYTTFSYANAEILNENEETFVQCEVTNTGKYKGSEIVQVYRAQKEKAKNCPVQELKGFEKTVLQPGETKAVRIKVEDWKEGYVLKIGSSSRDIRLVI
ncbi:MAG: glycoside hydrolase family 3 C-terminal domain-containing protein, partial [Suilimivivens sp.]